MAYTCISIYIYFYIVPRHLPGNIRPLSRRKLLFVEITFDHHFPRCIWFSPPFIFLVLMHDTRTVIATPLPNTLSETKGPHAQQSHVIDWYMHRMVFCKLQERSCSTISNVHAAPLEIVLYLLAIGAIVLKLTGGTMQAKFFNKHWKLCQHVSSS